MGRRTRKNKPKKKEEKKKHRSDLAHELGSDCGLPG